MNGRIDVSALNHPPEPAELETAHFFANLGKDIVFIRPSSIPGQRRPDVLMDGLEWEIKCPRGKSKRTIENNIVTAEKQSANIILDLRYVNFSEKNCLSQIELLYKTKSKIKRILVITKDLNLIEYS